MSNSTDKILQELEEERIRRATLTKEDLEKAYCELEKENFPVTKRIKFIADLGACKEIAYHYELICKDWEENKTSSCYSIYEQNRVKIRSGWSNLLFFLWRGGDKKRTF